VINNAQARKERWPTSLHRVSSQGPISSATLPFVSCSCGEVA